MSSHIEDESLPPHLKRSSSLSSFFISPPPSPVDDESGEDRKGYDSGEQQIDKDIAQLTEKMGDLGTVARSEPEACVFVASLSAQSSDEELQDEVMEHFGQWGSILSVKVSRDWMNRPFAFVQYETVKDATRALQLGQHTVLNRRKLRLEKARVNRTLFISRWPRELVPSEIQDILETFGPVEDVNLLKHRGTDTLKGTGFVKYRYRDEAIQAFTGLRHNFKWTVDWAAQYPTTPPSISGVNLSGYGGRRVSSGELDLNTLFFGNLDSSVTQEFLLERVSEFGPVESVQLIRKAETRPAFAFVRFVNDLDAEAALTALDSQDWNGRVVKVRYKERKRFSSWSSSSMESQHVAIPTGLMPPMYYAPMGYSIPIDSSGATLAPISPVSPESNYAILQQQQQQQQQQMQYGGAMEYPPPSSMSIGQQHSSDFVLPAAAYPTPMYAPVYDSAGNLLMVMGPQAYASSNSV